MGTARDVAVKVLDRVEGQGAFAAAALEAELEGVGDSREAGLASEIVLGVLRRRSGLDHLLEEASTRGLAGLDPTVMNILRAGVYQIVFLGRVPARAAVSEAVRQVKESRSPRLAGLANALLRKISASNRESLWPDGGRTLEERALEHGMPEWIFSRLVEGWGEERALEIARAFNLHSARTLRINLARTSAPDVLERLGENGAAARCLPWFVQVFDRGRAREIEEEGLASYQDEGSGLVVAALDPRGGEDILDACAGRGGKTATIASVTRGEARLTACDRKASKLQRLVFELAREGFAAGTVVADMTRDGDDPGGTFDRVLLDAPCSGTGTMGRRPEIRWRLGPDDVDALVLVQRTMLGRVAGLVRPGGRLVFAVCSVIPDESRGHAASFLEEHRDFSLVKEPPSGWPDSIPWEGGTPLVDPAITGTDGYGILCFERDKV